MNANVIIYYRVSSNEQTLGASLDVQEERLRKYCNQMGAEFNLQMQQNSD